MACLYCDKNKELDDLMIEICKLSVSTVYLFKEQTYQGRCNVVLNRHVGNLFDLDEKELHNFFDDVAKVAKAIQKVFSPGKINYGAYADQLPHFHMHLVPKYENGFGWGSVFEMNPGKIFLGNDEYIEMINSMKKFL